MPEVIRLFCFRISHCPGGIFRPVFSTLEELDGVRKRRISREHFFPFNLVAVAVAPEFEHQVIAFPFAQTILQRAAVTIRVVTEHGSIALTLFVPQRIPRADREPESPSV